MSAPDPRANTTPPDLARRILAQSARWCCDKGPSLAGLGNALLRVRPDDPRGWAQNVVCGLQASLENVPGLLDIAVAHYQKRSCDLMVSVDSVNMPSLATSSEELERTFSQQGFTRAEGMLVQVRRATPDSSPAIRGCAVERATTEAEYREFFRCKQAGELGVATEAIEDSDVARAFESRFDYDAGMSYFMAMAGRDAVATVAMDSLDPPQIVDVATLVDHRRRGLAATLVAHCICEAHRAGREFCWIEVDAEASPAVALYEKLGFRTLFTTQSWFLRWDASRKAE